MRRYLPAVAVLVIDVALTVAAHPDRSLWTFGAYLAAGALVVGLGRRPAVAFALAQGLAAVSGNAFVLELWTSYHAGRRVLSRTGIAVVTGVIAGRLAADVAVAALHPGLRLVDDLSRTAVGFLVFVALPVLAGRYVAQHERLVSELRGQRDLVAERERLRERLRIARDMHDSLGQRLSLVSIQAAALQVGELTPAQRQGIQQLAGSARGALSELNEAVGALRREPADAFGLAHVPVLVDEFRRSGVAVALSSSGPPRAMTDESAAYRVVQEGLTNAARHAPGQPVSISLDWDPDALLVRVTNPTDKTPTIDPGHGMTGLAERVELAGGFLEYRYDQGTFRLSAAFGLAEPAAEPAGRGRGWALGLVTGGLMFVILPAVLLLGAR